MLLVVIPEADIHSLGDSSMATVLGVFKYPVTFYGILEASLANKIYFINIKQFLRHGFKDSLCNRWCTGIGAQDHAVYNLIILDKKLSILN